VHCRKWEINPIKYETKNISEKNKYKESANKWEKLSSDSLFWKSICEKIIESRNHIHTECTNSWKSICSESSIKYCNSEKKEYHKYPCRENSIRYRKTHNRKPIYNLTLRSRNMRSCMMLCSCMKLTRNAMSFWWNEVSSMCNSCSLRHENTNLNERTRGVYKKWYFLQVFPLQNFLVYAFYRIIQNLHNLNLYVRLIIYLTNTYG